MSDLNDVLISLVQNISTLDAAHETRRAELNTLYRETLQAATSTCSRQQLWIDVHSETIKAIAAGCDVQSPIRAANEALDVFDSKFQEDV